MEKQEKKKNKFRSNISTNPSFNESNYELKDQLKEQLGNKDQLKTFALLAIEKLGYTFDERNVMRKYDPKSGKIDKNTDLIYAKFDNYEELGLHVGQHIVETIVNRFELEIRPLRDGSKIMCSPFVKKSESPLMLLINGSIPATMGMWSRELCLKNGLDSGSQIPYISKAKEKGFNLIILNTNNSPVKVDITDSEVFLSITFDGTAHAIKVWEDIVSKSKTKQIIIVAHSQGGQITTNLARKYLFDFKERVVAIKFTDSVHGDIQNEGEENELANLFKRKSVNYLRSEKKVGSDMPSRDVIPCKSSGHTQHKWTSHASLDHIFKELDVQFSKALSDNIATTFSDEESSDEFEYNTSMHQNVFKTIQSQKVFQTAKQAVNYVLTNTDPISEEEAENDGWLIDSNIERQRGKKSARFKIAKQTIKDTQEEKVLIPREYSYEEETNMSKVIDKDKAVIDLEEKALQTGTYEEKKLAIARKIYGEGTTQPKFASGGKDIEFDRGSIGEVAQAHMISKYLGDFVYNSKSAPYLSLTCGTIEGTKELHRAIAAVKPGKRLKLHYDTTFNYGNYYFSMLAYRHPNVVRVERTYLNNEAIIPIACIFHHKKQKFEHKEAFEYIEKHLDFGDERSTIFKLPKGPNYRSRICWL